MAEIPSELYHRLRHVCLKCGPFESDRSLAALFVDARLSLWQDALPETHNREDRVNQVIAFLRPQYNHQHENALGLLLHVLIDQVSPDNELHRRLAEIARALQDFVANERVVLSEDGRVVTARESPYQPLPSFDVGALKTLPVPRGVVRLEDRFYVERYADEQLRIQLAQRGSTTTIRAPRQTGKTSLLVRGLHQARERGDRIVFLDLQAFAAEQRGTLMDFLREFTLYLCEELDMDAPPLSPDWPPSTHTFTRFVRRHILKPDERSLLLAIDEADSLFNTDFYRDVFSLLRAWHNRRAVHSVWERFNLVLVISTEPYLLIDDVNQSPFNVGLLLEPSDFDIAQVRDLDARHGSPVGADNIPNMMALLNGHPFLTRYALYTLVMEGLDWPTWLARATDEEGPLGAHLRHLYWNIRDKPELRGALRKIVIGRPCDDDTAAFRLLKAGLIKGHAGAYTCRCDLYRRYFERKLR